MSCFCIIFKRGPLELSLKDKRNAFGLFFKRDTFELPLKRDAFELLSLKEMIFSYL